MLNSQYNSKLKLDSKYKKRFDELNRGVETQSMVNLVAEHMEKMKKAKEKLNGKKNS